MKVITIREGSNIKVVIQADNVGGGGGSTAFDGQRPITAEVIGFEGVNPGTTTNIAFLEEVFYPSEPPTASMTMTFDAVTNGSNRTKEFDAGSTENATMNWTAGRQDTTVDLSTIVVDGTSQVFVNPAQGATVGGTQAVTFPSNVNKSLVMLVTDTAGKIASDTITVNYKRKLYMGFTATQSPSDGTIQAFGQQDFVTSPDFAGSIVNGGGSQFFCIVFSLAQEPGGGVTVKLGGFDITSDFIRTTFSFTNASGGVDTSVLLASVNATNGDYNDLEIIS